MMEKTKSFADLKGMFQRSPGVRPLSVEEMRPGYEVPWHIESLVMTALDCFRVRFKDGVSGVVCFEPSFFTGVFEPLRAPEFFKQVYIERGAVTWPGQLNLAPEAMRDEIEKHGEWVLK